MALGKRWFWRAAWAAMAAGSSASTIRAEDSFAGKTIRLYIGYAPGGGYDLYARLMARHIGRHLPGTPEVIPQNMPGAGGLAVASFMTSAAPRDGTALAMAAGGLAIEQVLDERTSNYDARAFGWLGMITRTGAAPIFYTWHTAPTKTWEDLRQRETIIGAGSGGNTEYMPRVLNRLGGTKFRIVAGYSGTSEAQLALERGEVEANVTIWSELKERHADWLTQGTINPLVVIAETRLAGLPQAATAIEMGENPEAREVLSFLTRGELSRSIFTAPGVPPERLAMLRRAFDETIADTEFQADARRSRLYTDAMSGAELQALATSIIETPRGIVERAMAARRQ